MGGGVGGERRGGGVKRRGGAEEQQSKVKVGGGWYERSYQCQIVIREDCELEMSHHPMIIQTLLIVDSR